MQEIEVKFLDVEVAELEEKLRGSEAVKEFDQLYRRKVYDYPDLRLNEKAAWIRVRDEGDQVTMGYKQRLQPGKLGSDADMEEVEVVVSSFDQSCLFLESIGMKLKFYEENRRIRYSLGDLEFDIDFWPLLPPYLEIEAKTWEQIDQGIALLGLNPADKQICSTFQIYELHGINELDFDVLTFEKQTRKATS